MKKSSQQEDLKPAGATAAMGREKEQAIIAQIWAIVEPLCIDEGMELVFVQFQRESQGRVMRLFIDQPGGITVDDCANISRQVGDIVDATMEDIGPYSLEVSSPGINRPLGRREDFERFKGNRIHLKTREPIDGRKNYKGMLLGIENGNVVVLCEEQEVRIAIEEISIARLVNFNGENQCS